MSQLFFSSELQSLYQTGKLSQLVSRCQELLSELRAAHGAEHHEIALLSGDLARGYYEMGDFHAAIDVTKEILKLDRAALDNPLADRARNLSNLGLLYLRVGKHVEAELALERALELVRQLPPEEQWERPTVLVNMAHLETEKRNYTKAEELYLEAARQRLGDYHWIHPRFGNVYFPLGRLYWKMGRRLAAQRAVEKAIRIRQGASQTEDAQYAMMLAFRGDLLAEQAEDADAKKAYESALEILRRIRPADHFQVAEVQQRVSQLGTTIE
jgi:tetratricopeptide (TPR) repeat protein